TRRSHIDLVAGAQLNALGIALRHFQAAAFAENAGTPLAAGIVQTEAARLGIVSNVRVLARDAGLGVGERNVVAAAQTVAVAEDFGQAADIDAVGGDVELARLGFAANDGEL